MKVLPPPPGAPADVGGLLLDAERIQARVQELGAAITADYAGSEVVLVALLRGGVYFLADLCRAVADPICLDFMAISSYPGSNESGGVRITKDLDENIEGRHVLVVEDIVDTGMTLNYILGVLRSRRPASLQVAVLLDRDHRRIADVPIAYRGFKMPDVFAVGYGLDLHGRYRNLPYLGVLGDDVLESMGVS